jgi:cystathionine beta-lyase/cystathionine gamma-synthase
MNHNTSEIDNLGDSDPVDGEFAISGTLPSFKDVLDSMEGNKQFKYGYYRFTDHHYIRKIKSSLRSFFKFRHCILFTSIQTGIYELVRQISFENDDEPSRLILLDLNDGAVSSLQQLSSVKTLICDTVSKIATICEFGHKDLIIINQVSVAKLEKFDRENEKNISNNRIPVIAVLDNPTDTITHSPLVKYWLISLNKHESGIKGCALLSNNDRMMSEIYRKFRLRGALLSSRNAACILHIKEEKPPDPSIEQSVKNHLATLEHGKDCLLYPSGMNAITTLLDLLVKPGKNEVISIGHLYTDTYATLQYSSDSQYGIKGVFLDIENQHRLAEFISAKTAVIITESITNPLNDVPDIGFICHVADEYQVPVIIDNTIATPFNLKPLNLGATAVVHSTTKFFSGNNNHGGGAIVTNDQAFVDKLSELQSATDNKLSSLEAEILWQNLQSFQDRMLRFNKNSIILARFLEENNKVQKVYSNYLESHRSYSSARKILSGPGGVISFTLNEDNIEGLKRFYDSAMNHIKKAPSLGSNITLLCPYTILAHFHESDEVLKELGLSRYLIRVSVGCEDDFQLVIDDLKNALAGV